MAEQFVGKDFLAEQERKRSELIWRSAKFQAWLKRNRWWLTAMWKDPASGLGGLTQWGTFEQFVKAFSVEYFGGLNEMVTNADSDEFITKAKDYYSSLRYQREKLERIVPFGSQISRLFGLK